MNKLFSAQSAALALALLVTASTLGGLATMANTEYAGANNEAVVAAADANAQTIVVVGHRARG